MLDISRRLIGWAVVVALILLVPLAAMQFTGEVNWDLFDFIFMGILLFGACLTYELLARKIDKIAYRAAAGIAVVTALLLVWVNVAVGIIADPGNANFLYIGVLAVGCTGALITRFRPEGMARSLFATAMAQVLVAMIALVFGLGSGGPAWPLDVLIATVVFAALWIGSALLFRRASTSVSM